MKLYDLDIRLKILAVMTALVFIVLIINLVKKRVLKENFAILWMAVAFILTLLALNFNIVRFVSRLLGISDPNNTLFFLSVILIFLMLLLFSIEISDLETKVKNLLQETALLRKKQGKKKEPAP